MVVLYHLYPHDGKVPRGQGRLALARDHEIARSAGDAKKVGIDGRGACKTNV